MLGKVLAHLRTHTSIARLPGIEAIHTTVVHAERRGGAYPRRFSFRETFLRFTAFTKRILLIVSLLGVFSLSLAA
jgi:hypothetical protein